MPKTWSRNFIKSNKFQNSLTRQSQFFFHLIFYPSYFRSIENLNRRSNVEGKDIIQYEEDE